MKVMVRITALALTGLLAVVTATAEPAPRNSKEKPTLEELSIGAELYAENCASCHGANLEGAKDWRGYNEDGTLKPPPHDASGHTWHHTDSLLFDYVKLGGAEAMAKVALEEFNSGMPGFGDVLSDEEIWNVLDFIKSSWPEKIRKTQEEISNEDRESRARK